MFAIAASGAVTEVQYLQVVTELQPLLRSLFRDYLVSNDLDVMVCLTTVVPAALIGQDEAVILNGEPAPIFEA